MASYLSGILLKSLVLVENKMQEAKFIIRRTLQGDWMKGTS